jgi:hypothetical protein
VQPFSVQTLDFNQTSQLISCAILAAQVLLSYLYPGILKIELNIKKIFYAEV